MQWEEGGEGERMRERERERGRSNNSPHPHFFLAKQAWTSDTQLIKTLEHPGRRTHTHTALFCSKNWIFHGPSPPPPPQLLLPCSLSYKPTHIHTQTHTHIHTYTHTHIHTHIHTAPASQWVGCLYHSLPLCQMGQSGLPGLGVGWFNLKFFFLEIFAPEISNALFCIHIQSWKKYKLLKFKTININIYQFYFSESWFF